MPQDFAPALAALRTQLQKHELAVRETKRLINQLSALESPGSPVPHPDADAEADPQASFANLRRDQFYGMPLATAMREYLKMRRAATAGPATVQDIYRALRAGGFKFDSKNEANAKRGLYISLGKNTAMFHKLPGGSDETSVFGLMEWYPNAKAEEAPKAKKKKRSTKPRAAKAGGPRPRLLADKPEKGGPSNEEG